MYDFVLVVAENVNIDCYFSRTATNPDSFKLTFCSCCLGACAMSRIQTYLSANHIMVTMLKRTDAVSSTAVSNSSSGITVSASRGNTKQKKHHSCFFCGKIVKTLLRHILMKHKNEDEVMKLMAHPVKSKDRMYV